MKAIATIWLVITMIFVVHSARAQQQTTGLSYDLFGAFTTHDKDGNGDNAIGPGAGVNYLFTPNIGVGVDTYTDGIRFPYMLNASAIYRFGNSSKFTPYAMAGLGRQWKYAPQWTGHLGGGVDYTLDIGPSLFVDGRFVLASESSYALLRFGVRLHF